MFQSEIYSVTELELSDLRENLERLKSENIDDSLEREAVDRVIVIIGYYLD